MTAEEQREKLDKILDEYEEKVGIPGFNRPGDPEELENYLVMDRKDIESLSVEDCGYIAMRLAQFAFHIQRAQNRELARVAWAKNKINITTADKLQSYSGYGREEKFWQAVKGDEYAKKLYEIQGWAEQRAQRFNFYSSGLNNLAEMIKSIKFNKMRAEK